MSITSGTSTNSGSVTPNSFPSKIHPKATINIREVNNGYVVSSNDRNYNYEEYVCLDSNEVSSKVKELLNQ